MEVLYYAGGTSTELCFKVLLAHSRSWYQVERLFGIKSNALLTHQSVLEAVRLL